MSDALTSGVLVGTGALFDLMGSGLVAWGVRSLRSRARGETQGRRTTGRVVEIAAQEGMEDTTFYAPVVEFVTDSGETRRLTGVGNTQVEHPVGTQLQVYYDPLHPEQAGILGEGRLGPALLIGFGGLLVATGLVFLVVGALALAA